MVISGYTWLLVVIEGYRWLYMIIEGYSYMVIGGYTL